MKGIKPKEEGNVRSRGRKSRKEGSQERNVKKSKKEDRREERKQGRKEGRKGREIAKKKEAMNGRSQER